jgi:hypothetical protein
VQADPDAQNHGAHQPEPFQAPQLVFVTGAPRSATTFISDWIAQAPDAYCAHEISREVAGMTDDQIMQFLRACAASGTDRLGKTGIRDHMRWNGLPRKDITRLRVLGFKEPVFWPVQSPTPPYHADGFLRKFPAKYVIAVRHPYDVVASGKHRAATTATWPGFTTEQHALLWRTAVQQWQSYVRHGYQTICIRWEQLLLQPGMTRSALNRFLGIRLPAFSGYEHGPGYIEELRRHVSPAAGLTSGGHRHYLTREDIAVIRSIAGEIAADIGYELAQP